MKLFVKFICFVLMLGVAGMFFIKNPDGQPWLKPSDFLPDFDGWGRKLGQTVEQTTGEDVEGLNKMGKTRVFKWKDKYGKSQFSDRPPFNTADISDLKEVWIDPNVNLMEGIKMLEEEESQAGVSSSLPVPLPTTVPLDQVPKLVEDAKKVQDLMSQRAKELEKH
ncbi:MAG: hypothetical protein K6L73_14185 [Cellvibrionaceae bacterium]